MSEQAVVIIVANWHNI